MALQTKDFLVTAWQEELGGISYILRVTEDSVYYPRNSSSLTVQAILRPVDSSAGFTDRVVSVQCSANGNTLFYHESTQTVQGEQELVLYTHQYSVQHKSDGTYTLKINGWFMVDGMRFSVIPGEMELSISLPPSTIQATTTNIGEICTVGIVAKNAAFTHTVQYRFGQKTGYLTADGGIASEPDQIPSGVLSWNVPMEFYYQIPAAKYGTCGLTCTTYYNGRQVGSPQMTGCTLWAAEANCKPRLNAQVTVTDEKTLAITGGEALIRYYSTVRCTPDAAGLYGAHLRQIQVNGQSISGAWLEFPQADTGSYQFYVRDSRGWESEAELVLPVIDYIKPTLRITAQRETPGATAVLVQAEGTMLLQDFGLQENTLTLSYSVNGRNPVAVPVTVHEDGTFSSTFYAEDVDYTKSSRLTVIAEDLVDSVETKITIQSEDPVFRWDREQFTFCVPVNLKASVSGLYIRQGKKLQSRFSQWGEAGEYQPVWMFGLVDGEPVQGVLVIGSDGSRTWSGSPQLSFTDGKNGRVKLPSSLLCLSPEPIDTEE